jgi:hypothetical protein
MANRPAEEATIRAFIVSAKRDRYISLLASAKRRRKFLDCLNHCRDIDERHITELPSNVGAAALLRSHGAPDNCYVISDNSEIDGRVMPLPEAIDQAEFNGWGTIICCIPGQLAYYIDEAGSKRRLLLSRSPEK